MLQISFCELERSMKFSDVGSNPRAAASVGIIPSVIEGCELWQEYCQPKKKKKKFKNIINSRRFWAEIRADSYAQFTVMPPG